MDIKPKFKIGQKVWRIKNQHYRTKCSECERTIEDKSKWKIFRKQLAKICERIIFEGIWEESNVGYYVASVGPEDHFNEEDLFLSKQEAQAECDKRNDE